MASASLVTLAIPRDYGYVLLSVTSSFFLAFWHGARIGPFRKAAKAPYPIVSFPDGTSEACSASDASSTNAQAKYLFNCAQRAHGNFLENYVMALPALVIAGVEYPKAASALYAVWAVGRIMYAIGYTDPSKKNGMGRMRGSAQYVGFLGLVGLCGKVGWDVLMK